MMTDEEIKTELECLNQIAERVRDANEKLLSIPKAVNVPFASDPRILAASNRLNAELCDFLDRLAVARRAIDTSPDVHIVCSWDDKRWVPLHVSIMPGHVDSENTPILSAPTSVIVVKGV